METRGIYIRGAVEPATTRLAQRSSILYGPAILSMLLAFLASNAARAQAPALIEMQPNAPSGAWVGIVAVGWQQTTSSQNITITVPFYHEPPASPATVSAYLTTSIGPGTTVANQVAAATVTIFPSAGPSVGYILFSGLNLAAGSYYIVVDTGSLGIGWSGNNAGDGVLSAAPGYTYLGSYGLDGLDQSGYEPGYPVSPLFGNPGPASLNFEVSTAPPLRFVPMAPCRVVDTRDGARLAGFGPPSLVGEATRSFTIPNGPCTGIPANAQAYSINVTVVPQGELGYLTIWRTGETQPMVSTLNSLDGEVKANAAIVAAGTSGAISVFATNNTDLVLDINGYFVLASPGAGLSFYPMTPCRLVDTRAGAPQTIITGALQGGMSTELPILASSCQVPSTAQAYSLNFTLVPPDPVAYLTVYPTGESLPIASTLNDPTGTVQANAAIAPAGTGGSIEAFVTQTTDLVVDINGYFAPPATGALSLYTLPPCRVLDTRNPAGAPPFAGTINVNVMGRGCGGPGAVQAYVFNTTVVPPGPLGYLTLWPEGNVQPVVSTLNALDGNITSNMAIVPTSNTDVSVFADASTYLVLDLLGYFAP